MEKNSRENGGHQPLQQPTPEQLRILLVGKWLKRYADVYPMYGKILADFPKRPDEFLEEFKSSNPELLNRAFEQARGICTEFPTPADIRKLYDQLAVALPVIPPSRQIEDKSIVDPLEPGETERLLREAKERHQQFKSELQKASQDHRIAPFIRRGGERQEQS